MTVLKRILLLTTFTCLTSLIFAGDGMWLPFLLKTLNESEMQAMGMKMSAEDIYSVNQSSLKDAIGHFGGGCTSSVISKDGLLLTNHHCGYGYIQQFSTLENNYLKDGFWAKNKGEEIPCPGLVITFISSMEDVTSIILDGVADDLSPAERQSAVDKNINAYKETVSLKDYESMTIKPFFEGNQYIKIVTVDYSDVRMVGAPPSAIGAFGVDSDNWVWPRHSADFSLFRIYAGPDNLPAAYSADNKPYEPKKFLKVSMKGIKEGDFTLVFGFPGRTDEYLPSYAVEQVVDVLDPARIQIRDISLKVMDQEMRKDEEIKIKYARKYARLSNYWKKWQGEVLGLTKSNAVEKKQAYEADFKAQLAKNPKLKSKYGDVLPQFENLYAEIEPYALAREYYSEICLRNVELLGMISRLDSYLDLYRNNGEEAFREKKDRLVATFRSFYKDYNKDIDQKIFELLMAKYVQDLEPRWQPAALKSELETCDGKVDIMAYRVYNYTLLLDSTKLFGLFNAPAKDIETILMQDLGFKLGKGFIDNYKVNISPQYNELNDKIDQLKCHYMQAQMTVFKDKTFWPDANSTLRVGYGKVEGYEPKDAVRYYYLTSTEGIMEKYVPGDYEYDVPEKLLTLIKNKDYGDYAINGKMPVCFIGSNHTTGGNSGSPVLDAEGNLIGLNFDRAWEGTMSDINYDISLCRNIMVDTRYLLFIIDKFAGADYLLNEMEIVK
jgi:hypothetical protein